MTKTATSAFANAKGGALLLGLRDDGTIAGERLTNDLKARINSLARNAGQFSDAPGLQHYRHADQY